MLWSIEKHVFCTIWMWLPAGVFFLQSGTILCRCLQSVLGCLYFNSQIEKKMYCSLHCCPCALPQPMLCIAFFLFNNFILYQAGRGSKMLILWQLGHYSKNCCNLSACSAMHGKWNWHTIGQILQIKCNPIILLISFLLHNTIGLCHFPL